MQTSEFQSTHPLRGATRMPNLSNLAKRYFNPRTPCGVRRRGQGLHRGHGHFNPRTPCGVRREIVESAPCCGLFQSTHPLRGATVVTEAYNANVGISIHAPLAGCDPDARISRRGRDISIHAPLAGCDNKEAEQRETLWISIHAPLAGCDPSRGRRNTSARISIHAPLAGCDATCRMR